MTAPTPENDAADWRGIADQLTAEQIAELEDREQYHRANAASLPAGYPYEWPPRTESEIADLLLDKARVYAGDNLGTRLIGDVAPPAGVEELFEWSDARFGVDDAWRYFLGSRRVVERGGPIDEDIRVQIDGTQQGADGELTRHIVVIEGDYEPLALRSDHARQLGRALIAAADEVEQLNTCDPVVTRWAPRDGGRRSGTYWRASSTTCRAGCQATQ